MNAALHPTRDDSIEYKTRDKRVRAVKVTEPGTYYVEGYPTTIVEEDLWGRQGGVYLTLEWQGESGTILMNNAQNFEARFEVADET